MYICVYVYHTCVYVYVYVSLWKEKFPEEFEAEECLAVTCLLLLLYLVNVLKKSFPISTCPDSIHPLIYD